MVPDAEERLSEACNALGLYISENRSSCLRALSLLQKLLETETETEADASAASAAATLKTAAATHTPAAAQTPQAEGDDWLAEELMAAKAALLAVSKHAPNISVPLDLFELSRGSEEERNTGESPQGEPQYDPEEI